MGYMRHNAIVVTGYDEKDVGPAWNYARKIFGEDGLVSYVVESKINGYSSFFIAPDGSKEGWDDSDKGDSDRELFIQYLSRTYLDYVEISYGGDEPEYSKITARNGYDSEADKPMGYREEE